MNFNFENKKLAEGYKFVVGCDEVGRGCLAGPVVAAAVILDFRLKLKDLREVRDSKLLTAKKREELSEIIKSHSLSWSIAEVSSDEVDKINIHNASLLVMKKAVDGLFQNVAQARGLLRSETRQAEGLPYIFVDGKFTIPNINIDQQAIIAGDNKVLSIAAASIIAKVYRDELMQKFDKQYPVYNFGKHKGYATEIHRHTILQNGLTPIHRLTFCKNLF